MIPLEAAREQILALLQPLPAERIPLSLALGRVPAFPLVSPIDLPPFDNASVDGYAVRAVDVAGASQENPVRLAVSGVIPAGTAPTVGPAPGSCLRIFTGAPVPRGCDAVVMQEDTRPADPGSIWITDSAKPWENVRFAGEDVRRGGSLLPRGRPLQPPQIGLLASAGIDPIEVHQRPRVALVSTGSELQPAGETLRPGGIHDSNGPMMAALAARDGAEIVLSTRIPDTLEDSIRALEHAASAVGEGLIVSTGGVSVGDADRLKPAFAAAGGSLRLWRIAMKPGKPFAWGQLGRTHWFGLPGNPVSAFVTWVQLVRPAIRRLLGIADPSPVRLPGILAEPVANRGDRRHFVRVILGGDGSIRPAGPQASHIQSSLATANALLDVPTHTAWPANHPVQVEWLGET